MIAFICRIVRLFIEIHIQFFMNVLSNIERKMHLQLQSKQQLQQVFTFIIIGSKSKSKIKIEIKIETKVRVCLKVLFKTKMWKFL